LSFPGLIGVIRTYSAKPTNQPGKPTQPTGAESPAALRRAFYL